MCFAPQRRALLRHRNFQKWSDTEVFCTFLRGNVLRATTACTFSTSQLPKVVRTWCALYILTCKCASRHNGMQFFISHLASWLRTRRFSEPTFRPSGDPNHWKNTVFRDFPTFSRICIFFLLTLLSSNLSLLSASSLLCFSSVHIVGSLTSKLPSNRIKDKRTGLPPWLLVRYIARYIYHKPEFSFSHRNESQLKAIARLGAPSCRINYLPSGSNCYIPEVRVHWKKWRVGGFNHIEKY